MTANLKRLTLWRKIFLALSVILPTYWAYNYSGIYRFCSELQLEMFAAYMPLISFVCAMVAVLMPAIYLTIKIDAIETQGMTPAQAKEFRRKKRDEYRQESQAFERWLNGHRAYLVFGTLFVLGAVLGGSFLWTAYRAGSMISLEAKQLTEMNEIPERYLSVQGCYGASSAVEIEVESRRGGSLRYYFPCMAAPGDSAKLIIMATGKRDYQDIRSIPPRRLILRGIVGTEIPGYVVSQLRSRGITLAERVWVMDEGSSPESYRTEGKIFGSVIGGIGVFGMLATFVWRAIRRRKN